MHIVIVRLHLLDDPQSVHMGNVTTTAARVTGVCVNSSNARQDRGWFHCICTHVDSSEWFHSSHCMIASHSTTQFENTVQGDYFSDEPNEQHISVLAYSHIPKGTVK